MSSDHIHNANVEIAFHVLGCGSSGGVPRINGDWGICDPHEPKNRRRRCSVLVQQHNGRIGTTQLLIDTSPDLREQLLAAQVDDIDAIAFTHDHADQTHGIDDIRALVYARRARLPCWLDQPTFATLNQRFGYCFSAAEGSEYPALLDANILNDAERQGGSFTVSGAGGDMAITAFRQIHGSIESLGFRVGNVAYSSDISALPEESEAHLQNLSCWIIDALRLTPHPTHLHLDAALDLIDRLKPRRAILTNLHIDMDYNALREQLPDHVEPAYDGMVVVDAQ